MKNVLMMTALGLTLASCGKNVIEGKKGVEYDPTQVITKEHKDGNWTINEKMSREGDVYYKAETLPKDIADEVIRNEYKDTVLYQVPVDTKFNAQLFKIENDKRTDSAAFLAPKIYVFNASETDRFIPIFNKAEDSVTFIFPIMFIDGVTKKVRSPSDPKKLIDIPESLLVTDEVGLRNFLDEKYGNDFGKQALARLPGCPKSIRITLLGKDYDVAKETLKRSDFCDLNVPMYVSIKVPYADGKKIVKDRFTRESGAKITAQFETRVPYKVANFKIEFNKAKIYEDVMTNLSVKKIWGSVDLHMELEKIVRSRAMKISIQGDLSQAMQTIIAQATDAFFEKLPEDLKKNQKECGVSPVCFQFSYKKQDFTENFKAEWNQTSTVLSGVNIGAESVIHPLNEKMVSFEDANESDIKAVDILTFPGDQLYLNILKIKKSATTSSLGPKQRIDNQVKVGMREVQSPGCLPRSTIPKVFESRGGMACRTSYVPVYENQFTEVQSYETHEKQSVDNTAPAGKESVLADPIQLVFSWRENGEEKIVECNINDFLPIESAGEKGIYEIENKPTCEIFKKENNFRAKIKGVKIRKGVTSNTYKKGEIVTDWRGNVVSNTVTDVQEYVKYTISGELKIPNYGFSE